MSMGISGFSISDPFTPIRNSYLVENIRMSSITIKIYKLGYI